MSEKEKVLVTKSFTKVKKEEIKRMVKAMLEEEGLTYEDWLAELEFQYFLSNMDVISDMFKNKSGGM